MESQQTRTEKSPWPTLVVVCLVSILIGLNSSTINVALPALTRHFDATQLQASWLVLGYMVASTACLLLFGRISDIVDQRRFYLFALALYTLSSLACGLAPTVDWLIALRILAALGGAILLGNGATLIHAAFPRESLGSAMGLYAASFPIASLVGPIAAGMILEITDWRWVFWMNVPIGLLALVAGCFLLPRDDGRDWSSGLDLPGNVLVIAVISLTTVGISLVTEFSWSSPWVYGSLLLALALLPALALTERRSPHPVIDLDTLRQHGIGLLLLAGFFLSAGRFPAIVLMSLYIQGPLDFRPSETALLLLPMPIGSILASLCVGRLSRRRPSRQISALGAIIGQVGVITLTVGVFTQSTWTLGGGMVLMGMGTGLFIGSNATSLLEATPESSLGVVNGMRLAVQNTGNVLSLAVALTLMTVGLSPALSDAVLQASIPGDEPPAAVIAGFGTALILLSVLGLAGTILSIVASLRPTPEPQVHEPAVLHGAPDPA